jgi:hypothetical protein
MTRIPIALAATLVAATAFATPPAAPQVTVGASQVKQLRFDWEILPRSNYYELWFKANSGAPEVKFSESVPWRPTAVTRVSAHLLDWEQTRYRVKACNPSGCGSSPLIPVKNVLPDTVGILKSPFPLDDANFGTTVKISEDGSALAVVSNESNEEFGDVFEVHIYIFRWLHSEWRQEAQIFPMQGRGDGRGLSMSISGDGSRLVLGLPDIQHAGDAGEAYFYHRIGTSWILEKTLALDPIRKGLLAAIVDINSTGDLAVVSRDYSAGDASTNGRYLDIYKRAGTTWAFTTSVAPLPTADLMTQNSCRYADLSADGSTLARACMLNASFPASGTPFVEVLVAPSWTRRALIELPALKPSREIGGVSLDYTGNTFALGTGDPASATASQPGIAIYHRTTGAYVREALLTAGSWASLPPGSGTEFGVSLQLSRDGQFLAVGDSQDFGDGNGVLKPPLQPGSDLHGAVYVYQRVGSTWSLRRVVKPNLEPGVFGQYPYQGFGFALSLGNNGKTLIVAQPNESTYIPNPDNHYPTATGAQSGAVWTY